MKSQLIDFESLLKEKKEFSDKHATFPSQNQSLKLTGLGLDSKQEYIVDINRKRCILSRITYQNRVYTDTSLLRLDIDTKPHRNPDGKKINGTHLHVYREGYADAWAYELNNPYLKNIKHDFDFSTLIDVDLINRFYAFSTLCNFTNIILLYYPLV